MDGEGLFEIEPHILRTTSILRQESNRSHAIQRDTLDSPIPNFMRDDNRGFALRSPFRASIQAAVGPGQIAADGRLRHAVIPLAAENERGLIVFACLLNAALGMMKC